MIKSMNGANRQGLEELARVNGKLALMDMLRPSQQQDETDHEEMLPSGTPNSSDDIGGENGRMTEPYAWSIFILLDGSARLFSW